MSLVTVNYSLVPDPYKIPTFVYKRSILFAQDNIWEILDENIYTDIRIDIFVGVVMRTIQWEIYK